jgi:signal transduction histidine kinase
MLAWSHARDAVSAGQGLAIDAAASIGASPDLAEVMDGVLRRAVEVARAERGSISRADDERMVVDCEHDRTGVEVGTGTTWLLPDSALATEAVRIGRPLRGGREAGVPVTLARWCDRAGIQHVIACPLLVGRQLVGVLGLSRRREPFRDEDLVALRPFAALAAVLLRDASLLAEARQACRAKATVLSLAAHELRTPLAVLRGYLSMLEDGTYEVPQRTAEAIGILAGKAQELESLVESLLIAARLDAGRVPPAATAVDAAVAVRQALDRLGPRARLEGARLEARLPDGALLTRADGGHVARILDNLLNNALTYSQRPAQVHVAVRSGRGVEIVVRDRGVGIPADQRERVFERFARVDGRGSRFTAGLGLGLSISRELAQINGGSLVLEGSRPGQGSTFVLRLPALGAQVQPSPRDV